MSVDLAISRFDGVLDVIPKPESLSWEQLAEILAHVIYTDRKSGVCLWSPGSYTPGATRKNVGVERIYLFVGDVDDGSDPVEAHRRLVGLGLAHVIHSTYSSTPAHPKFRIVVPLVEPVLAGEWPALWAGLCALIAPGHVDVATSDVARMYYVPSARPGTQPFFFRGDGHPIDPHTVPRTERTVARPASAAAVDAAPAPPAANADEVRRRMRDSGDAGRLAMWILETIGADARPRNLCLLLLGHLRAAGASPELAADMLACADWSADAISQLRPLHPAGVARLESFPEVAAAWRANAPAPDEFVATVRDWIRRRPGARFITARDPAPAVDGRACAAPVYENKWVDGQLYRGDRLLVIACGDPDRTSPEGEAWRTAHTIAGAARIYVGRTYVYSRRFPWDVARPRSPAAIEELRGRVAGLVRGVFSQVDIGDALTDADAGGTAHAYIDDMGIEIAVDLNAPVDLPGFHHVATLGEVGTADVPDIGGKLDLVLKVLTARRRESPGWFRDALGSAQELGGVQLHRPLGSARKPKNRVVLYEEEEEHYEHVCPVGRVMHADHDEHVWGKHHGGPALLYGGSRELSLVDAEENVWERWIEGCVGRVDHGTIEATVAGWDYLREIWVRGRGRPPPWRSARGRGRGQASP